jgi:mycothiol synthase
MAHPPLAPLPPGYRAEPLSEATIPGAAALLAATQEAERGQPDISEMDFRGDLEGLDLASETLVVLGPDGQPAAYADVDNKAHVRVTVYPYVHPSHTGRGIGRFLVAWGEDWAHRNLPNAPADAQVVVRHLAYDGNAAANRLLERAGYPQVRVTFVMEIDDAAMSPPPDWPGGFDVRALRPGVDEPAAYEAHEEAFADHWGRPRGSYERFLALTRRPYHDPSLWFLASDGPEIAGLVLASIVDGSGWIDVVAVRRPWRGRGLALALLRHAFAELAGRGIARVGLAVDAFSPTGAVRLYERAGMHVVHRYNVREKVLRPGRDLTVNDDPA